MTETTPDSSMGGEEAFTEEERSERFAANKPALPEDGYEWKKYGQKFIKNIAKYRAYFKCQKANCQAKKRAEWSISEAAGGNLRVVYEGVHDHATSHNTALPSQGTSASANQYNLLNQFYGDFPAASSSSSSKHPSQD